MGNLESQQCLLTCFVNIVIIITIYIYGDDGGGACGDSGGHGGGDNVSGDGDDSVHNGYGCHDGNWGGNGDADDDGSIHEGEVGGDTNASGGGGGFIISTLSCYMQYEFHMLSNVILKAISSMRSGTIRW